ncbi:hypothetical protein Ciccas_013522 [Cichlidogyrus casuarinus]|uniref:Diacylglycerol kinase iota-like domain-containing protein n=1 Tax=Cichlidogyrus casuarinus TaxID=1844966 RepID=A0ABD2PKV9_9PLAT
MIAVTAVERCFRIDQAIENKHLVSDICCHDQLFIIDGQEQSDLQPASSQPLASSTSDSALNQGKTTPTVNTVE